MANDIIPAAKIPLVDARGRPLVREHMTVEIAGPTMAGVRSHLTGHPADGLTPARLGSILRGAEQGNMIAYLELAEQMEEKELHYLSVLGTRKRAISQLPITVDAADESDEAEGDAELIRDWLERDTLESELFDILDAIGKGFSVTEIVWGMTAKTWLPDQLKMRDPRWFEFDRVDGEKLYLRGDNGPEELSAAKYITHVHPAKSGLPIRGGLARPIAWAYLFKNYAMKDWLTFLDAYGQPLRLGRYDNGESEDNIRILMRAVSQLGSDAAAVLPKSMVVDFVDRKGGEDGGSFHKLAEFMDLQVSKAVLGQTATTDAVAGGLGSGQATAHNDVRGDIERADAKLLAATLNRDLVPWIIMFNRGARERYPRLRIGRPEAVDVKALVDAVERLVPLGFRVGVGGLRKKIGIEEPGPDEEVLHAPAAKALPAESGMLPAKLAAPALLDPLKAPRAANERRGSARHSGVADEPARDADAIDNAVDGALANWQRLIGPLLAPIETAIAEGQSLEDLRDTLSDQLGEMDVSAIAELLARAAFAARLKGDAETDAVA